ncbi:hypothetical protein [Bradyrhizobium sp. USDA 4350]
MRTTFALDLNMRPVSVNAPKTQPHIFAVGDVLYLTASFATEYGIVPEGTKLFVNHVADDDGTTWLLAEGMEPALIHWDNMLVIAPYDTEDLLLCLRAAIRCPGISVAPEELPASNIRRVGVKLALVVAAAALVGWATPQRVTSHNHFFTTNPTSHVFVGTTHLVNS